MGINPDKLVIHLACFSNKNTVSSEYNMNIAVIAYKSETVKNTTNDLFSILLKSDFQSL